MIGQTHDTIIAPATAFGNGGIGILRLSGENALPLLRQFFHPRNPSCAYQSHRLYLGVIGPVPEDPIDEVMAVYMAAPHTYTREQVVEIHCHGGREIAQRILQLFLRQGARMAQPGEFTLRAFLNGRIDLTQAEGVAEIIEAHTASAHRVAVRHLQGQLGGFFHQLAEQLRDALALLESWVDFPEEDIDPPSLAQIRTDINVVCERALAVQKTFREGRMLREGLSLLILGKPNVGKSSLLNRLLGSERAIVTDIPGTTRDLIEEQARIGDFPVRLVDTAGIRASEDPVELEGIRRAYQQIATADLILLVVDGHKPVDKDDRAALAACGSREVLLVCNKMDLGKAQLEEPFMTLPRVAVSARDNSGFEQLRGMILEKLHRDGAGLGEQGLIITEMRHYQCLDRCLEALGAALRGLSEQLSPELIALEVRLALSALTEITGESTPEMILERIFSRFCIGK